MFIYLFINHLKMYRYWINGCPSRQNDHICKPTSTEPQKETYVT